MLNLENIVTPEEALDCYDEMVLEYDLLVGDLLYFASLEPLPYTLTVNILQARIDELNNRLTLAARYYRTLPC